MDFTFFGTSDTDNLLAFDSGSTSPDHGTAQQNGHKGGVWTQQKFRQGCAQCLESRDMGNGFSHDLSNCCQDCASPCAGGDDCDLPQACYNEHCEAMLCEQPTCPIPPCTAGPCNDASCPEGPCSIDTTCYDTNCFAGKDPSAFNYEHSVPQTCPPGQCQGFAPGQSMNVHGQHFQPSPFATPMSGFQMQPSWSGAEMLTHELQQEVDHSTMGVPREPKRRRVDDCSSYEANHISSLVNPINNNFQPDLTNHLLQFHFGSGMLYPCANNNHDDLWLNQTLLEMGVSSDLTDHLLHSHMGSQTIDPCSNNDHNELWLNQTFQSIGQDSSDINHGFLHGMFNPMRNSIGTPISPVAQTPSTTSPTTLMSPSTGTMSDMGIFSDDEITVKNSAIRDSNTTTPEDPPSKVATPTKPAEFAKEPSREFDLTCRWVIDDPLSGRNCEICCEAFKTPKDLDDHIKAKHVCALSKNFPCHWLDCPSFLSHDFHHRGKLLRHIRGSHSHYHEHVCPHFITTESGDIKECGKTFCTKEQLKNHLTKHTGEKQYVCQYPGCNHRSATKTQHKTHERTHSGEKPYACPVEGCNHRSGDSSNLSKHVRNRHPEYGGRGKGRGGKKRRVSVVKVEEGREGLVTAKHQLDIG